MISVTQGQRLTPHIVLQVERQEVAGALRVDTCLLIVSWVLLSGLVRLGGERTADFGMQAQEGRLDWVISTGPF